MLLTTTSVRDKQNTYELILARVELQIDIAEITEKLPCSLRLYAYALKNDVRIFVYNQTRNYVFLLLRFFVRNTTLLSSV